MTRAAKTPDAFGSMLAALRAVYEAEILRLADLYRPRILAGEFSGHEGRCSFTGRIGPEQGDLRCLRLEDDLGKTHPWLATERSRIAVVAASRWLEELERAQVNPRTGEVLGSGWDGAMPGETAAECMTHDVLAVAATRGWVKPLRHLGEREWYALRVA